jgi:hypothetical protein
VPFESKAQQRWMFANKPRMAERWADHTPDIKALPEKKGAEVMRKTAEQIANEVIWKVAQGPMHSAPGAGGGAGGGRAAQVAMMKQKMQAHRQQQQQQGMQAGLGATQGIRPTTRPSFIGR